MEIPLDDPTNDNNCVITYFEDVLEAFDLKGKLIHDVVMQYVNEPTFNQLRTIEQLGYIVTTRNC
jgi:secreted Zn-dependent insulinase-like peptidase